MRGLRGRMRIQVVTVLMAATLSLAWSSRPQVDANLRSALISMTRKANGIFAIPDPRDLRQDPVYSVSIAGDGTVTYIGGGGVRTLGKRTHKTKPEMVAALVAEFEQAGFWSLRDRYEDVELGNGVVRHISELPSTTVVYSVAGKTKSVYDYYGTPAVVRHLEDRIDEIANSRRYTGRPPNKSLQPTAAGAILNRRD